MQYTYRNEDGEETTPFRELVQHMPGISKLMHNKIGNTACIINSEHFCMAMNSSLILIDVAEIVLNKCMEIADPAKQSVKFNYDYIDDFAEPETQSGSYNCYYIA